MSDELFSIDVRPHDGEADVREHDRPTGSMGTPRRIQHSTLEGLTPLGAAPPDTGSSSSNKQSKRKLCCWNCDGAHNLSECKEKRDGRRISEARRRFDSDRVNNATPSRYANAGGAQRNSVMGRGGASSVKAIIEQEQMRVGEISYNLRLALGLRNDQLPPHIIAMQRLGVMNGYPPAWLARACLRRPAGADDRLTMITHADDDDLRRQEDGEIEDGFNRQPRRPARNDTYMRYPTWKEFVLSMQERFNRQLHFERQVQLQQELIAKQEAMKNAPNVTTVNTHTIFNDDDNTGGADPQSPDPAEEPVSSTRTAIVLAVQADRAAPSHDQLAKGICPFDMAVEPLVDITAETSSKKRHALGLLKRAGARLRIQKNAGLQRHEAKRKWTEILSQSRDDEDKSQKMRRSQKR